MATYKTLDDLAKDMDLVGAPVLVRVDLNVPMQDGKVTDATRIERVLPTIQELVEAKAKVVLLAHFGRPKGKRVPEESLKPVADAMAGFVGKSVGFAEDCIGEAAANAVAAMQPGDVLVLENTRYHAGEEKNDAAFAKALAATGKAYVNDAFSCAHRAHASTEAIAHCLPAYAGRAMEAELTALEKALEDPVRPVVAIVGGAKVSTKIDVLGHLSKKVDYLVIGGGMANTFLAAQGHSVGKSLCEHDLGDTARAILKEAEANGCAVVLPKDGAVASEFKAGAPSKTVKIDAVPDDKMILDAGSETVADLETKFADAKTVVWNGPLGAFEIEPFDAATVSAARYVAKLTKEGQLVSVAGGGDTVAALNHAGVADDFSYVSTAGGAFLEWLEGKTLPGVKALETV